SAYRRDERPPRPDHKQPAPEHANEEYNGGHDSRRATLEPARRAAADLVTHDEPEIEASRMNQHALQDVGVSAQMRAAHPARLVQMRKGAFDPFAALAHQTASASTANSSSIPIHRRLSLWCVRPGAAAAVRLRDVGANAERVEFDHDAITVIPLVGDDLFQRLRSIDLSLRR